MNIKYIHETNVLHMSSILFEVPTSQDKRFSFGIEKKRGKKTVVNFRFIIVFLFGSKALEKLTKEN